MPLGTFVGLTVHSGFSGEKSCSFVSLLMWDTQDNPNNTKSCTIWFVYEMLMHQIITEVTPCCVCLTEREYTQSGDGCSQLALSLNCKLILIYTVRGVQYHAGMKWPHSRRPHPMNGELFFYLYLWIPNTSLQTKEPITCMIRSACECRSRTQVYLK